MHVTALSAREGPEKAKDFTVEPLDLSDEGVRQTTALLKKVWPGAAHLTVEYIKWLYRENPHGAAFGCNACAEGRIVGHYAAVPVRWVIEGEIQDGLLSLNTAVDESFRGRGLFRILAGSTYKDAAEKGRAFVIGVANAQSTPLFLKQFKFQLLGPMTVKVGIGQAGKPPEDMPGNSTYSVTDTATIEWRLRAPHRSYFRANEVPVVSVTSLPFVYSSMGVELLADNVQVVSSGLRRARSPLRVWIGYDPRLRWRGSAYLDVPSRLRPSPLNVIFKDLTPRGRVLAEDRVRMSLIDFDAY
jgi:predicted N-acetyltransferase YhbS